MLAGAPDEAGIAEPGGVGRFEVPRRPRGRRRLARCDRCRLFADRSAPGRWWGRWGVTSIVSADRRRREGRTRLWCDLLFRPYSGRIGFPLGTNARHPLELTTDDVRHIAQLARVALSDEDVERFRAELWSILEHCQALNEVDTADVPPTAQSFNLVNVERDDEPGPADSTDDVLANAPRREADYFRVRAVLD
ncbi:MAG: Asp-tRNA(Asn)/Glu-tRNA(Gln) amidotransferase subunit GatC [Chloroflexi bacterium]|nr:Asp-tRNA(Asn)/Glu-tRNA(Gln) amidotransferase subunit GatC [Chloroflexota bacterium]